MKIAMIAPRRETCGIADYADYLVKELRDLVDVDLVYVGKSANFNAARTPAELVHIQHQYFLYGGIAPWRNRFARFARSLKAPAVLTAHEFVELRGSGLRRAAIGLTNRLQFAHRAIRRIIVHTDWDRDRMARAGLDPSRIRVIRHGVPDRPDLPPRSEARQGMGLDDRFVVTLFGFLSRRKGHVLALDALKRLPDSVTLLFAGGRHPDDRTTYAEDLERRIESDGLRGRARITGYLSPNAVNQVMSATDLVLAPFAESSGSGSLALGFACGRPILGSDIPPHQEMLAESAGCMETFSEYTAGSLADAVIELYSDAERLRKLAAGSAAYAEKHSYHRAALGTAALYRAVLEDSAR